MIFHVSVTLLVCAVWPCMIPYDRYYFPWVAAVSVANDATWRFPKKEKRAYAFLGSAQDKGYLRMAYFLTGDFNNWVPDQPRFLFTEVTSLLGNGNEEAQVAFGAYSLETDMPAGRIQFKIVEDGKWDRQWSVWQNSDGTSSQNFSAYGFQMRHGLAPRYLVFRGGGMSAHAEMDYPGGPLRWDFHPTSRTLTVHAEFDRTAGPVAKKWCTYDCGGGLRFDTWVCLPYGYNANVGGHCTSCLVFDGRSFIFGEDTVLGVQNDPRRQWPRVVDALARHGVIAPVVFVAIGVPYRGNQYYRKSAYLEEDSKIHHTFSEMIRDKVLPDIARQFHVPQSPDTGFLAGHSNGGDMALSLLCRYPEAFGGAIVISPGATSRAMTLRTIDIEYRKRLRLAMSYSSDDLSPGFVTTPASIHQKLTQCGVSNLVFGCPECTHDPASIYDYLYPLFSFVLP